MGQIPPWADLPQELLSAIASCLNSNPIDILRFRCVCKSWFSSSLSLPSSPILSPLLPLRLPRPPYPLRGCYSFSSSAFSLLSATVVYALRPPAEVEGSTANTWILFVDQLNPGKVSIRDPITCRPFSMPLDFPRKLNLLDFRVSEIGRFYNLSTGYSDPSGKLVMRDAWSGEVVKVVFLSNGSAVVVLSEDGKLGLLRLGGVERNVMDSEWEIIHDGKGFRFDDIVEYKRRFLGIDRRGRVYEMGHDFSGMNVIVPPITGGGGRRKRLIESSGILHLVVRCDVKREPEKMGIIRVYQLNEKTRRWAEVMSTGDHVFFFDTRFAFSASAQEFEGFCGKNCIMYEERSFWKYDGGRYGDEWLFYGLGRSCLKVGVYHLEDGARLHAIESYPCYSDILWPPPAWIWLNTKLKFLGTIEAVVDRLLMGIHDENLKAKYKELSSLVGFLVSGDSCDPQQTLTTIEELDMLKKFMTEIVLEIEKESKRIEDHIIEEATSRQTQTVSTQLPNQIGNSEDGTEDKHGCVHFLENANEVSTRKSWLSREVRRKLLTHIDLSRMLRYAIDLLEHKNLKVILESSRQASLSSVSDSADGEMKAT